MDSMNSGCGEKNYWNQFINFGSVSDEYLENLKDAISEQLKKNEEERLLNSLSDGAEEEIYIEGSECRAISHQKLHFYHWLFEKLYNKKSSYPYVHEYYEGDNNFYMFDKVKNMIVADSGKKEGFKIHKDAIPLYEKIYVEENFK